MPHLASGRPPRSAPPPVAVAFRRAVRRGAGLLGLAAASVGAAACGGDDPFAIRATDVTTLDTLVVYPLTGSSPLLPSALDLLARRAVRPALRGTAINFDVAFDRDASGIVLYAPRALAAPLAPAPVTRFQGPTTAFDALVSAPRTGYDADSAFRITPGRVVALEGQGIGLSGAPACASTRALYAKLIVDSVATATGALHLRVRTNPNCGFRSFQPGIPTD